MPVRRLIAAVALSLILPQFAPAEPVTQLVIFGDSLSDAGNVSTATGGAFPPAPYAPGRFSNGPVWAEQFATRLGVPAPTPSLQGGLDYAYGFAQTGMGTTASTTVPGLSVPNIGTQVSSFLSNHTPTAGQLFVLWGGANDFFHNQTNPAVPAQNIADSVSALAKAGATNFLVLNLPALGEVPYASQFSNSQRQAANALTAAFNQDLQNDLKTTAAANPGITIHTVDIASLFSEVQASPSSFGLTNAKDSALFTGHGTSSGGYLFWDSVHPTTQGHGLIADAAVHAVPEPGALTLLGVGLAALALRRCPVRRAP
jgi:phospholipase/lecithinase/hemolysin